MNAWRKWNTGAARQGKELTPPAEYLRMSYYEKWLTGLIELTVNAGLATRAEVESGEPAPGASKALPALTGEQVPLMTGRGAVYKRDPAEPPRFRVGQAVRARNIH